MRELFIGMTPEEVDAVVGRAFMLWSSRKSSFRAALNEVLGLPSREYYVPEVMYEPSGTLLNGEFNLSQRHDDGLAEVIRLAFDRTCVLCPLYEPPNET